MIKWQRIARHSLIILKIGFFLLDLSCRLPAFASESTTPTTSVFQLTDVRPSDWSFQALQSLIERYGCSAGTNQANFAGIRPGRSLTRYEFAAALNSCLSHLESVVSIQELSTLRRLRSDFAPELAKLQSRVTNFENLTTQLENTQFSTTTKLRGEILWNLGDTFGDRIDDNEDNSQTFFGYRARISFETSFTGKDRLRTRIESRDIAELDEVTGTVMTRLETDGTTESGTEIDVIYQFPWGESTEIAVGPVGVETDDIGIVLNPLDDSTQKAISRFGLRDPGTLRGPEGAGFGIKQELGDRLEVNFGYVVSDDDAFDPRQGRGFFQGSYSAIAQFLIEPNDNLNFAFTYTRIYERSGDVDVMSSTGSVNANNPFGDNATSSDNFGLQFNWKTSPNFELGGWFGYTQAYQERGASDEATILNGALTFVFPDLFAQGNLGGIIIGIPPLVTDHDNSNFIDRSTSWHLEAIYRISVSDNIAITPGVFLIINPINEEQDLIWVGNIRTRFSF
jgi:hypothetical protein